MRKGTQDRVPGSKAHTPEGRCGVRQRGPRGRWSWFWVIKMAALRPGAGVRKETNCKVPIAWTAIVFLGLGDGQRKRCQSSSKEAPWGSSVRAYTCIAL